MKKTYCTILLIACTLCLSAQVNQPAQTRYIVTDTETYEDESFVIDTALLQKKNYEFYADDSILLKPGFSRLSAGSMPPAYFYTNLVAGGLGFIRLVKVNKGGQKAATKDMLELWEER